MWWLCFAVIIRRYEHEDLQLFQRRNRQTVWLCLRKYKSFALKAEEWSDGCGYYKTGVKLPGDIDYFFPTFHVMSLQLEKLKDLGFNEDLTMQLDFGAFTL